MRSEKVRSEKVGRWEGGKVSTSAESAIDMSAKGFRTILLLVLVAGCSQQTPTGRQVPAKPPPQRQSVQQARSPVEQLALSTVRLNMPVRLDGRDFLVDGTVTFYKDGKPVPYREADVPVRTGQGQQIVFELQSLNGDAPAVRYQIVESRDKTETAISFASDTKLPDLALMAKPPTDLLPVQTRPRGEGEVIHSVMGPAWFASFDGLYDPRTDRVIGIDQPFQYTSSGVTPGRGTLGVWVPAGEGRDVRISFKSRHDFLKTTQKQGALPKGYPTTAPAGWCAAVPGKPGQGAAVSSDYVRWLETNLGPYGGKLTQVPGGAGRPEMFCSAAPAGAVQATQPVGGPDWKKKLDKTRDIYGRVLERGEKYNWQHAKELLAAAIEDYWAHGTIRTNIAAPLLIDSPLHMEHARMWVSLLGLSGQGVVLGDDLRRLSAERLELIYPIIPPLAIRSADLYSHGLPDRWVVGATREWRIGKSGGLAEPVLALGLFNWSPEPRQVMVRLTELMPPLAARPGGEGSVPFAIHDFWRGKLKAVTNDAFMVPLEPTSCAVFCMVPLMPDRPALIGSNRHITENGPDLSGLKWDPERLTLSGVSKVIAHRPYELRLVVPDGPASFEIEEVVATGGTGLVRNDGPVRIVTFQSEADANVEWSIRFAKAAQQVNPPNPPSGLTVAQNTRGVLLNWNGQDERAVMYRVYRDEKLIGETAEAQYQDSTALYDHQYNYGIKAVDYAGRESQRGGVVVHRTPVPASTNLTDLVPLVTEQEHLAVMADTSAAGNPLRVAGKRYHRGLGMHSNGRMRYFLGSGYQTFSGEVGVDDETEGKGSCQFKVLADGELLFTSKVLRGGNPAQAFSVPVRGRMMLELIVTDGGDSPDNDHADWGNPYLQARVP